MSSSGQPLNCFIPSKVSLTEDLALWSVVPTVLVVLPPRAPEARAAATAVAAAHRGEMTALREPPSTFLFSGSGDFVFVVVEEQAPIPEAEAVALLVEGAAVVAVAVAELEVFWFEGGTAEMQAELLALLQPLRSSAAVLTALEDTCCCCGCCRPSLVFPLEPCPRGPGKVTEEPRRWTVQVLTFIAVGKLDVAVIAFVVLTAVFVMARKASRAPDEVDVAVAVVEAEVATAPTVDVDVDAGAVLVLVVCKEGAWVGRVWLGGRLVLDVAVPQVPGAASAEATAVTDNGRDPASKALVVCLEACEDWEDWEVMDEVGCIGFVVAVVLG